MIHICNCCGEEKPFSEFNKHPRMRLGILNTCKECLKPRQSSNKRKQCAKIKEKALALFGNRCGDCGGSFHQSAMDFHHEVDDAKEHDIARIMGRRKWSIVEAELAKCILLCANCHRIRHSNLQRTMYGI